MLLSATTLSDESTDIPAVVDNSLLEAVATVIDAELFEEALNDQREIALLAGPNGRHWQWLVRADIINNSVQETVYVSGPNSGDSVTVYVLESVFPLISDASLAATLVAFSAEVNPTDVQLPPATDSTASETPEANVGVGDTGTTTSGAIEDNDWPEPPVVTIPIDWPGDFPIPTSVPTTPKVPVSPTSDDGQQPDPSAGNGGSATNDTPNSAEPTLAAPSTPPAATQLVVPPVVIPPKSTPDKTQAVPIQNSPFTVPLEVVPFHSRDTQAGTIDILTLAGGGIQLNFAPAPFHADVALEPESRSMMAGVHTSPVTDSTIPEPSLIKTATIENPAADHPTNTFPDAVTRILREYRLASDDQQDPKLASMPKRDFTSILDELFAGLIGPARLPTVSALEDNPHLQDPGKRDVANSVRSDVDPPESGSPDVEPGDEVLAEEFPRESLAPQRLVAVDKDDASDGDGGQISVAEVMESELLADRFEFLPEDIASVSTQQMAGSVESMNSHPMAGELARAMAFAMVENDAEIDQHFSEEETPATSKTIATSNELPVSDVSMADDTEGDLPIKRIGTRSTSASGTQSLDLHQAAQLRQRTSESEAESTHEATTVAQSESEDIAHFVNEHWRRRHTDVLPLITVLALERFIAPAKTSRQKLAAHLGTPQKQLPN